MSRNESLEIAVPRAASPRLWRLSPIQLHDRWWASWAIQVVRPAPLLPVSIDPQAELFLLLPADGMALFGLRDPLQVLSWTGAKLLSLRVRDRTRAIALHRREIDGWVTRVEGIEARSPHRLGRAALTPDPELARSWQRGAGAMRELRRICPRERCTARSTPGAIGGGGDPAGESFIAKLSVRFPRLPRRIIATAGESQSPTPMGSRPSRSALRSGMGVWAGVGRIPAEGPPTRKGSIIYWDNDAETRRDRASEENPIDSLELLTTHRTSEICQARK